jgi:CTP synthase
MQKTKYIFVVGGVLSGVGKGVATASIGRILKNRGLNVSAIKIDPYVNVDAGTMNPVEHGETFVTEDAYETDQNINNYERFLDVDITSLNYMTTGSVYQSVIEKERSMYYKGKCVQVVPHIPMEVIERIKKAAEKAKADVMVIEVGGTVGEYENILFLEAARMMKLQNPDDVLFVLVSYLPIPGHLGEMKTKPTQHAARALNSCGIQADFIIARGKTELDAPRKEKLAIFCGLRSEEDVVAAPDVASIYEVPSVFEKQNLSKKIAQKMKLKFKLTASTEWNKFIKKMNTTTKTIKIAVVGKYFGTGDFTLADSYISVIEAIKHAAWFEGVKPELTWIDSEDFENGKKAVVNTLENFDAIIVPGGFGSRGIAGIIGTISYARENNVPYLGLCYGMQLACVEFARFVLGKKDANTVEIDKKTTDPIIHINPRQQENVLHGRYGGTMRLGAYDCLLQKGSKTEALYKEFWKKTPWLRVEKDGVVVSERHRHRYEFNNDYKNLLEEKGMECVGVNPEADLVEIIELKNHPYFVGSQFHPEFKSRPLHPHPLFVGLVRAGMGNK